jgi:hypothetical protein
MAARYGRSAKYEQALRLSKKGVSKSNSSRIGLQMIE